MKKFLLFLSFIVVLSANAQEFGVKGGLNFTFFKVTEGSFGTNPDTEVGFYGGFFTNFEINNNFNIQPELLFIAVTDFTFLNAPIYMKYNIGERLHILVGPSLNYFFDFFSNKFKVRADLGFAYNLSNSLDLNMKYTLGFEELSPNMVFIGLGYRL